MEEWLLKTERLLEIERKEEISLAQEELEKVPDSENPNVLTNLRVKSWSTALFGRVQLKFSFPSQNLQKQKPHHFSVGDLVQIRFRKKNEKNQKEKLPTGVVSKLGEVDIAIIMDDDVDLQEEEIVSETLILDRLVNNATFNKITKVLEKLRKFEYTNAQSIIDM
jgi:hypothetical protein